MLLCFTEKIVTPLIPQRGIPQINNAWPCNAEPFMLYNSVKLKSLTRSKTNNAPLSGSIISLQRERDSNPRYVAIYTLSKRAPSATRPPLYFITAAKNIKKNELEK